MAFRSVFKIEGSSLLIIFQSNFHAKKEEKNITHSHAKEFDTDFLIDYATDIFNGNRQCE
jgi:hypothetical protein